MVFVSVKSALALSCSINSSCSGIKVLLLENETGGYQDAHAENTSVNAYDWSVCCTSPYTLTSTCEDATILRISNLSDAHVQKNNYTDYAVPVCLSTTPNTINCTISNNCDVDYTCLASIASSEIEDNNQTNMHVSNCTGYSTKVCCKLFVEAAEVVGVPGPITGEKMKCVEGLQFFNNYCLNLSGCVDKLIINGSGVFCLACLPNQEFINGNCVSPILRELSIMESVKGKVGQNSAVFFLFGMIVVLYVLLEDEEAEVVEVKEE